MACYPVVRGWSGHSYQALVETARDSGSSSNDLQRHDSSHLTTYGAVATNIDGRIIQEQVSAAARSCKVL